METDIFKQIENHFNNSDNPIWIYEKRAWWEIVFCFNLQKNDIWFSNYTIKYLNEPIIWNFKF